MGLSLNTTRNYLVWGNTEGITYGVVSRNGAALVVQADNQYPVAIAKRRAPTYRELSASNGAYTGQDLVWLVPAALIALVPKPGDRVLDASLHTWTVLEVALNALQSTWRLMTRNLALAYQLYDVIDVQRPAVTYDAAGGVLRNFPDDATPGGTVPYPKVTAKVQLVTQEIALNLGIAGMKGTYAVIVAQDVSVQKFDRVKWITGGTTTYLDVLGQHDPQRIDQLPVLDCVAQP
jgi:hypothetical protein